MKCLTEVADPERLLRLFGGTGVAKVEGRIRIVGCLEDGDRPTGLPGGTGRGPMARLSEETPFCIRRGYRAIDVRWMMLETQRPIPALEPKGSVDGTCEEARPPPPHLWHRNLIYPHLFPAL